MRHGSALIIKFIMVLAVLWVVLSILTPLSFSDILIIALAVTGLSYVIGDLFILPKSSNTIATIADAGLAFVTIYLFNYIFEEAGISITDALIASAVIAVGEWIFHKYVDAKVFTAKE